MVFLRMIHWLLGFSSRNFAEFLYLIRVLSSHHQPTVLRITVESLWKTGQGNRTQYCFNSSGFGESFIRVFYTRKKREANLEDEQDRTGQEKDRSPSPIGP